MGFEREKLVDIITGCLREVAEDDGIALPELAEGVEIFGEGGFLDSAALVSLVAAVEEAIDEREGISISLVDERAMSQKRSPFQSIGSLADYACLLIDEGGADG